MRWRQEQAGRTFMSVCLLKGPLVLSAHFLLLWGVGLGVGGWEGGV